MSTTAYTPHIVLTNIENLFSMPLNFFNIKYFNANIPSGKRREDENPEKTVNDVMSDSEHTYFLCMI